MMTMKEFCMTEAEPEGVKPGTIHTRISRGRYQIEVRRINSRVVFVLSAKKLEKRSRSKYPQLAGLVGRSAEYQTAYNRIRRANLVAKGLTSRGTERKRKWQKL